MKTLLLLSLILLIGCKHEDKAKEYHYPDGSYAGSALPEYIEEEEKEASEDWNAKWAWSFRWSDDVFYNNLSDMSYTRLNHEDLMRVKSLHTDFDSKGWMYYNKYKIEGDAKYRQHLKDDSDEYTEWELYQELVCYYVLKLEGISLGSDFSKYSKRTYNNGSSYDVYKIRFKNRDQFKYHSFEQMYRLILDDCKQLMLPQHTKFTLEKTESWEPASKSRIRKQLK